MDKNERIKVVSLIIIDDIEETLWDIKEEEITSDEGLSEIKNLLKKLKKGISQLS